MCPSSLKMNYIFYHSILLKNMLCCQFIFLFFIRFNNNRIHINYYVLSNVKGLACHRKSTQLYSRGIHKPCVQFRGKGLSKYHFSKYIHLIFKMSTNGEEVKNTQKSIHVVYGWPHCSHSNNLAKSNLEALKLRKKSISTHSSGNAITFFHTFFLKMLWSRVFQLCCHNFFLNH